MAHSAHEPVVESNQRFAAPPGTLRELYCRAFQCAPQDFEQHVLFHCSRSGAMVRLLWRVDPDFFQTDVQLIRLVSHFQSFSDCRHEVEAFRRANPPRGFLRKRLQARLSGQRLLKVASKLFLSQSLPQRAKTEAPAS